MRIPYHQVNAFVAEGLLGNPAGVCLIDDWLDDAVMQHIAAENGLSETAFVVSRGERYDLRWLTPTVEVDLCGHATLASASVVLSVLEPTVERVVFDTRSGPLTVSCADGDRLAMDLPAWPGRAEIDDATREAIVRGLGVEPVEILVREDALARLASESQVRSLDPDMSVLSRLRGRGVIATAPADDEGVDFVSRFFAPACGVPEDPVTGSAHCMLTPYWSRVLGENALIARQISRRGGELRCTMRGERVTVAGRTEHYLEGEIIVTAAPIRP